MQRLCAELDYSQVIRHIGTAMESNPPNERRNIVDKPSQVPCEHALPVVIGSNVELTVFEMRASVDPGDDLKRKQKRRKGGSN